VEEKQRMGREKIGASRKESGASPDNDHAFWQRVISRGAILSPAYSVKNDAKWQKRAESTRNSR